MDVEVALKGKFFFMLTIIIQLASVGLSVCRNEKRASAKKKT